MSKKNLFYIIITLLYLSAIWIIFSVFFLSKSIFITYMGYIILIFQLIATPWLLISLFKYNINKEEYISIVILRVLISIYFFTYFSLIVYTISYGILFSYFFKGF